MFNGSPLDKRLLWYSNIVGDKVPVVDEWGNETSEYTAEWSERKKLMVNISPPSGAAQFNPFGMFTDYNLVVSAPNKQGIPLYEGTRVWFGDDAEYVVVKVAEHITDTLYALKEVAE